MDTYNWILTECGSGISGAKILYLPGRTVEEMKQELTNMAKTVAGFTGNPNITYTNSAKNVSEKRHTDTDELCTLTAFTQSTSGFSRIFKAHILERIPILYRKGNKA